MLIAIAIVIVMFSLIVISHSSFVAGEAAIIQQLFVEGLACFHLRKPEATESELRQLLHAVPATWHNRIALHHYHHLADEYDIHRLHYTEQARVNLLKKSSSAWPAMNNKKKIFTTSVHSLHTLRSLPAFFSYTFLGPVFNSISKENYKGIAGKDFYLDDVDKAVPVIALGGIDEENISQVAAMNFDGAAVLGALWNEPDRAVERFKLLNTKAL